MPVAQVKVGFRRTTGVPADVISNTWYFRASEETLEDTLQQSDAQDLIDALAAFYGAWDNSYMSNFVTTTVDASVYDMNDAEPRLPVLENTFSVASLVSSAQLPCDVAAVLSFQADSVSGQNPARRRGRIYLGPLVAGIYTAGTGDVEINSGFRSAIETGLTAMDAVLAAISPAFFHAVFSPTTFASTGDMSASCHVVDTYTMDNQTDTQRRRGRFQNTRSTLSP